MSVFRYWMICVVIDRLVAAFTSFILRASSYFMLRASSYACVELFLRQVAGDRHTVEAIVRSSLANHFCDAVDRCSVPALVHCFVDAVFILRLFPCCVVDDSKFRPRSV